MSEFDLIRRYFTRSTPGALLGVGDDAALLQVGRDKVLAVSSDMLVCGTHFFADADPFLLGHKTLAVNLSDLAAMGAVPRWATLALALPYGHAIAHDRTPHPNPDGTTSHSTKPASGQVAGYPPEGRAQRGGRSRTNESRCDVNIILDDAWLEQFSAGFFALADQYGVELIGGDTTRGPLNLCVTIFGEVEAELALRRSGAKDGDEIWVSGKLGDAALALAHLQGRVVLKKEEFAACAPALHQPQPRVALGLALRGIAGSAIDISDGLLADLMHILDASQVGAELALPSVPASVILQKLPDRMLAQRCLLSGGDDYELCFTVPASRHNDVLNVGEQLGLPLTCIGKIVAGRAVRDADGNPINTESGGYDHFR
jgi:thiamine-monophosphate kinase